MITVRVPAAVTNGAPETLEMDGDIPTIAVLLDRLARERPTLRLQLDDALFNFAVNDEMLLHAARERALRDGDVVEVVPAIAGGVVE